MSLTHTLYPHRQPAGERCPGCPEPASLVVCLPPDAAHSLLALVGELSARLAAHVTIPAGVLDGGHFPLWRHPDATESPLLLLTRPDPDLPLTWCAGGPVGLLDLAATAALVRRCARHDFDQWSTTLAGTPPARPWSSFLDAHHGDPDAYPLARAFAEFEDQPRIAAMAAAPTPRFAADLYGPGLEALQAGPDGYADYQTGLLIFADGLVTLDARLLVPSFTPVLVEQTYAERQLFHDQARRYVAALQPTTLLVAVRCAR